jgi:hypothetical protein
MSNGNKTVTAQTAHGPMQVDADLAAHELARTKKVDQEKPKSILVKTLTFTDAHPMFDARRSISSETQANKGLVIIEFIPSLRHHRIERHSTGGPPKIQMVHETAVAGWEPL